ncbi:MAG TPA: PhoPQ-activated pathogenicity [Candidatus Hydrogenedentes bacterium]|nr:PhoPQ-activated pathogenicity [Candidatus Hydrogenedentota bacterium]
MNLNISYPLSFAGLLLLSLVATPGSDSFAGPLKDYVDEPDSNYSFSLAREVVGSGYTRYVLDLTAQSWKEGEVTPHLWKHWVTIIRPDNVAFDSALLVISGGNNNHDKIPNDPDEIMVTIAKQTRSVVVELQGIPNEPVQFSDETETRNEDAIIAYSYDKFMTTGDPTWPLLVPMVKSTVRAMDAVQKFMDEQASKRQVLESFVLVGASKRGWTTWLTAAIDDRVKAIAPLVIDMLNLDEQMAQTMEYYGRYTEATQDYTQFGIQDKINTAEGQALLKIVDPFEYRDALTMPKLVMLGAGDQYWTVDSANLYFQELKGPKYIRYEPNADHGIDSSMPSITALANFYYSVINGNALPDFDWEFKKNGSFEVTAQTRPKQVRLWTATAPTMDFRLKTIGGAWKSSPVPNSGENVYAGNVPVPEEGFTAYFVEMIYPGPLGMDYSLTTLIGIPGKEVVGEEQSMGIALLLLPIVLLLGGVVWMIRR